MKRKTASLTLFTLFLSTLTPAELFAERILKVITFNVAGIPLIHPHISQRIPAIARRLKEGNYDLAFLQEVWIEKDIETFKKEAGFPYAASHYQGWRSNGLVILSKFPILKNDFIRYTNRAPMTKFFTDADALVRKGAIALRLKTPYGEWDVYNTHLIAKIRYLNQQTIRMTQIFELFELTKKFSEGRPFMFAGDFNFPTDSPEKAILDNLFGLQDICLRGTRDICGPTSRRSGRIDYLLVADKSLVKEVKPSFKETFKSNSEEIAYSDHKAIEALFSSHLIHRPVRPNPHKQAEALKTIETRIENIILGLKEKSKKRRWIPLYGFFHSRWTYQLRESLTSVKNRALKKRQDIEWELKKKGKAGWIY
ncbi:MAG: endonuclease/exonuclease/phosphatase family protein [Elusimicrobia bacterium]|nr:endonuclease/exonuclease/phosphatase family protein [Elusimicrobiota bacterium]